MGIHPSKASDPEEQLVGRYFSKGVISLLVLGKMHKVSIFYGDSAPILLTSGKWAGYGGFLPLSREFESRQNRFLSFVLLP